MRKTWYLITVLGSALMLAGCLEDLADAGSSSSDSSSGSSSSGGSSSDALSGPQVTYNYTCDISGSNSISVTDGPCLTSQKNYALNFGCNYVDNFASACNSFYSCAVNNSSGDYRSYYQQYLDYCAYY